MSLRIEKTPKENLLVLVGDLTVYTVGETKAVLLESLTQLHEVEFDLAQIRTIDSAGIQLLMLIKREAAKNDCNLRLSHHSTAVLSIFELYNLANYFGDPLFMSTADTQATATVRSSL